MALRIRLTRLGDKGNPFYRVVVSESRSPRDGKFIDNIGTFDPKAKGDEGIKIEKNKATEWIAKGALPTDTARTILQRAGILDAEKPKAKTSKPKAKPAEATDKKKEK